MKYKNLPLNYGAFIWGRIKKVYLPYLLWTAIYYLYLVFRLHRLELDPLLLLKYMLGGDVSAQFYFILVIMQLYLLMPLWLFLCKRFRPVPMIFFGTLVTAAAKMLTAASPYTNRIFLCYLVFWLLGCCAGMYGANALHKLLKRRRAEIYTGWTVFAILHTALQYLKYFDYIEYPYPEIIMILFCIFSILGFYLIVAEGVPRISRCVKNALLRASSYTYYIYLVHCLIIFETDFCLTRLSITSIVVRFALRAAVVYLLSFLLCALYAGVKRRLFSRLQSR